MLVATAAATRSVRFGIDHATALDHAEGAIAKTEHDRTAIHVLIRRGRDIAAQVNNVIERHPGADQKYIEYQVALASIVALQLADGQYAEVIDADDQSILEVQEQLRGALTRRQIRCADLGLQSVQQIILMAGLSESGKSSAAEYYRDAHGYTRLKIGALIRQAADRMGVRAPYTEWGAIEQSEHLATEILNHSISHKNNTFVLDSARSYQSTIHFKRLWGKRCTVVYMDAPLGVRLSRTRESRASIAYRDSEKTAEGADAIRELSHYVVNSSKPHATVRAQLLQGLSSGYEVEITEPSVESPDINRSISGPLRAHLDDTEVRGIILTGSTTNADWRQGWSDIDVLVVRNTVTFEWLHNAVGSIPQICETRVAVTAVTTTEYADGQLPLRCVLALRRAADGHGVLLARDLPPARLPNHARTQDLEQIQLPQIIATCRRLLTEHPLRLNKLYKHCILLMKILLGASEIRPETNDEVIAAFARNFTLAPPLPRLDSVATSDSQTSAVRVAEVLQSLLEITSSPSNQITREIK